MRRALLVLALFALPALAASAQEEDDISNEYRITLFPNYPIKGNVTGFGYLGFVDNPDKDYQLYYVGWPGVTWAVKPTWLQLWGGVFGIYTNNEFKADKLELRPFVGAKALLPNAARWHIYNFTRLEYRLTDDYGTHAWSDTWRLRSRFGLEIPLASRERAFSHKTFYGIADVEPFYRFDRDTVDPLRLRAGLGYIFAGRCRGEFIYHMQFTRPDGGGLQYTDNIWRLNVKIGLKDGILPRVMDAEIDE
jgi:hypothetical protein